MLLKIGIWVLAGLGLIFVILPFFGYSLFDFQCQEEFECTPTCEARTIFPDRNECITAQVELGGTEGCYKNCASRNKKCGFDEKFKDSCVDCVKKCKETIETESVCITQCYNLTSTE